MGTIKGARVGRAIEETFNPCDGDWGASRRAFEEVAVDQNDQPLLKRVADARAALAEAVSGQNPVGLSEALDELEEALRQAREGGVEVPPESGDKVG
ncbi:hypothetical protein [Streptacidiphilus neutrinimicus]|uniref:hypothetical protein n=1 Tax=Streptacidiphilus neutrinimicus TaxID=105420 RepID=UPI001269E7BC|nr:hypothetical protein [Streptacidiphilus neutrinimicus]